MNILNKIGEILEKISSIIVIILTAVMCVTILLQVAMRYFFNSPLVWSEELARYAMIWVTFLGTAIAQKRGTLVCVDMFVNMMSEKVKNILGIVCNIIELIFGGVLAYYSFIFAYGASSFVQTSTALHVPMWIVYTCVPLGFTMIFYHALVKLLNRIIKQKNIAV